MRHVEIIFSSVSDNKEALFQGVCRILICKGSLKIYGVDFPRRVSDTAYTPYYYGTDSANYEMDFTIQKGKDIVPIEVKAEVSNQAKSLKAYCQKFNPGYAVRISMKDYREEEWLTNIPLYAVCNV